MCDCYQICCPLFRGSCARAAHNMTTENVEPYCKLLFPDPKGDQNGRGSCTPVGSLGSPYAEPNPNQILGYYICNHFSFMSMSGSQSTSSDMPKTSPTTGIPGKQRAVLELGITVVLLQY